MASRTRTIREVEIKLRITNTRAILRQIRHMRATSRGRVLERNVLYDTPESDFQSRGRLLRLRIETPAPEAKGTGHAHPVRRGRPRAILTSKVPAAAKSRRYKEKLETEVVVADTAGWQRAIRRLGLREGFRYEKYRTSFRLGRAHLELDETPVGVYLEIEGPPPAIDRLARALGFARRDYIRSTYWDLYAADCRRRGLKPRNMVFHA